MNYQDYQTEDFIQDPFFVRWVRENDPESKYFWERFLSSHPEKRRQILAARELIASIRYQNTQAMPPDLDQAILEKLVLTNRKSHSRGFFPLKATLPWAAVLAILAVAVFWFNRHPITPDNPVENVVTVEFITRSVPNGQKVTLRLPDQTLVKLNSGSTIRYEKDFDQGRQVELSGEAFFEVMPDSTRPFSIQSSEITTTVLGTSFNIMAYPEENRVQVAVVSGKVRVTSPTVAETLLTPDQVATYDRSKKLIAKEVRNIANLVAWRDGILIFEHEGILDVKDKLEKWYGVEVVLDGSFQTFGNYSGKYHNESLESVLEGITYASGLQYELNDRIVILKM